MSAPPARQVLTLRDRNRPGMGEGFLRAKFRQADHRSRCRVSFAGSMISALNSAAISLRVSGIWSSGGGLAARWRR